MRKFIDVLIRIQNILLVPIRGCKAFFVFAIIISNLIWIVGNVCEANADPFLSFLLGWFDCYVATVLVWLLKKIKMSWLIWIVASVLMFGELFTVYYYHSNYTVSVIKLLIETHKREVKEFATSALAMPETWMAIAALAVVYAVVFAVPVLLKKVIKGKAKIVVFAVIALLTVWSGIRQVPSYVKLGKCVSAPGMSEFADVEVHLNTPFVRFTYGLAFNVVSARELDVLVKSVEKTKVEGCSFRSKLIVMIIGESFSKYHNQLYVPDYLPTMPHLMKMKEDSILFTYNDVVTTSNLTSNVFKSMFTTWDATCQDDWTQHTLFPAVFRKAGYNVHYVTNQYVSSDTKATTSAIGGTIFNQPQLAEMQFTSRNAEKTQYDETLIKEIPSMKELEETPTLLIFHVEGQHVQYRDRFPKEFAKFKPEESNAKFGGDLGDQITADYNNATLYNDYVVDSVLSMFKDKDAIAIYFSDHGEEVFDWRDKFERTSDMSEGVARYQYEVPFMFILPEKYKASHPDIAEAVVRYRDRRFITSNICHLLFYLAGIDTKEYKEELNLLSPKYNNDYPRIIRGDVDYDEVVGNKKKQ